MAISDGVFVAAIVDALNNDLALDLGGTGFKLALFTNSLVPDFSQAGAAYGTAPFDTNEIVGTGYTAGGVLLTGAVFEDLSTSPGSTRWTFNSPAEWTSSTITNARGGLFHDSTLSGRAVLLRTFGQDYSTQDGTLSITFHTSGVWVNGLVSA